MGLTGVYHLCTSSVFFSVARLFFASVMFMKVLNGLLLGRESGAIISSS